MSDKRAQELIDLGNRLFTNKLPLDQLCQEIAEQCYPERADFTVARTMGEDFGAHLTDSYPVLARRELGNSFSAILRPRNKAWFAATANNEAIDKDAANARFLNYITTEIRSAIYDPRTDFIGASKMADHDFASFGQGILSVEIEPTRKHLFIRPHHFRDCAWLENELAVVDHLHRKDRMTARQMKRKFGEKKLAEEVKKACEKEPNKEFDLRVIVMPSDEYDYTGQDSRAEGSKGRKGAKLPFTIVYIDVANAKVLRETGLHDFLYMVARWHRVPGSPYAFSPAAMTALPDSRLSQELALLILEAGEKSVHPPFLAREEAVTQANVQSGSLTWVDLQADQKIGEAMAALNIQADMRVGFDMRRDVREIISRAWFLDKLKLPDSGTQRTAYEIARIIEDHVRNLLPLFEPMEIEYNTRLLDKVFNAKANMGGFDWSQMPRGLVNKDIFWTFKNPMAQASERILVTQFQECMQLIAIGQQAGVKSSPIKISTALDDAIRGVDVPATWRTTDEERQQEAQAMAMQEMIAGAVQDASAVADVAGKAGQSIQQLQGTGILPPGPQQQQQIAGPPQRKALPAPARAA